MVNRESLEPRRLTARLRGLPNRPLFLLTALGVGLFLMFGAPLLRAQSGHEEEPETAVEHMAPVGDELMEGAHEEEGTVHPPTLFGLLANLMEGEAIHDAAHAHNPVARFLVTYQAPLFSALVALVLCGFLIAGARSMSMLPGNLQNVVEFVVESLAGFVEGVLGPEGRRFVPFLGTLFLYIYLQNIFGLIPFMFTPTSVLSTTVALALVVFVYVQWVGLRSNGVVGYLRHLAGDPQDAVGWAMSPLMFPLHVVGELAKPVSLSLRLFGNMMGEETLIAVFIGLGISVLAATHLPVGLPLHVPFLFLALLTTFIQALVFMLLSTIYFALVLPHHDHEGAN
jgi:F-type H+-transporting ATPase subunit a